MPNASPTAPTVPSTTWTETALQAVVLDLLAELLMEDRDELEQRLSVTREMPVDSLDMMDIIAGFKQRTGLSVPKGDLRRHHMRSVSAFAGFVSSRSGT